jgi:hypothetical protein
MSATGDLERRIAEYYTTEAPSGAPDWLLERALDSIDTIPQRRAVLGRPWRSSSVPSPMRLVLAAVAIVAVSVVGLTVVRGPVVAPAASPSASPEPSASPSPSLPPPLTERFDSATNGISVSYPAGWQVQRATVPWTSGVLRFGEPGVDVIFDPASPGVLYIALASEPLDGRGGGGGITLPDCPGGHGGGVLTFDGAEGWVVRCGHAPAVLSAVLSTETHRYAFVVYLGNGALADTYGDDWFLALLRSADLRAEDGAGDSDASAVP